MEVFPRLREHLDAGTLETLRTALIAEKALAHASPPAWPESAVGNLMTGPFLAVVDRVRHAITAVRKPLSALAYKGAVATP